MSVRIRLAGERDVSAVTSLALCLYSEIRHEASLESVAEAARSLIGVEGSYMLLAFEDLKPIGLLTLMETAAMYAGGRFGVIQEFYVTPDKRSAGVGHLLLEEAQRIGLSRGWSRLEVTATAEHITPRSAIFYRKKGFDISGPRFKLTIA